MHVDDVLMFSNKEDCVDLFVKSLSASTENYKYLGVETCNLSDGTYKLKQSFLTKGIIDTMGLSRFDTQKLPTPFTSPPLHKDLTGKDRLKSSNYCSVIGMLTCLQGTSRPDISIKVHQCAWFYASPKLSHERAVTRIGRSKQLIVVLHAENISRKA